jgi:hypothetical protein
MGATVLTSYQTEPAVMPFIPEMRGYIHCTRPSNTTKPGSVTLAFLNVDAVRSFALNIAGVNTDGSKFGTSVREEYMLSSAGMGPPGPHQSTLSSLHMLLNGNLLALGKDDQIPELLPHTVVVPAGGSAGWGVEHFVAPPRTYGYGAWGFDTNLRSRSFIGNQDGTSIRYASRVCTLLLFTRDGVET